MSNVRYAERNARICELRGKMSAAEIGQLFGCSRNAVIGVWWRAGLCDPHSDLKGLGQGVRSTTTPPHIRKLVVKTARRVGPSEAARQWGFSQPTVSQWMKTDA